MDFRLKQLSQILTKDINSLKNQTNGKRKKEKK